MATHATYGWKTRPRMHVVPYFVWPKQNGLGFRPPSLLPEQTGRRLVAARSTARTRNRATQVRGGAAGELGGRGHAPGEGDRGAALQPERLLREPGLAPGTGLLRAFFPVFRLLPCSGGVGGGKANFPPFPAVSVEGSVEGNSTNVFVWEGKGQMVKGKTLFPFLDG